jgi:hypothetical protein
VPGGNDPREADVEQANNELNEGLKSCRAVVDNYRAMLSGEGSDAPPADEAESGGGEPSPNGPQLNSGA